MANGESAPDGRPPPAGFLVRLYREQARLTQAALARHLDVDVKTLNSIECGRSDLTPYMACRIAEALGRSDIDLMAAQLACERWRVRAESLGTGERGRRARRSRPGRASAAG